MAHIIRILVGLLLVTIFLALKPTEIQSQDNFPKYCLEHPQNLVRNCEFNEGLNHWTPYVLAGAVDISTIDGNRCHTVNHPCGYMSSAGGFVAGIYQQVPVNPGGIYDANLQLLLYDSFDKDDGAVGRRIGIDPTGGTDPNSPNIVWSPEVYNSLHRAGHKLVWEDLKVTITAQSNTVTVFVWVNNLARVASPLHQFWIDEIGMIQIGQAEPTPVPIPPTNTPVPPTPTPLPPTETPTPLPTDTPVPTDTPLPTDTPTPTPTETSTATPLPTDTATATPAPPTPQTVAMIGNSSASSRASGLVSSATVEDNSALLIRYGFLCFGIGGVVMGLGILGVLIWFYRVGSEEEIWE